MKHLLIFVFSSFLCSCVHTAIAPVASPLGVPVVVRVPGARAGQKATREQIGAIDQKVDQELRGKSAPTKPDPGIIDVRTMGVYGDMKTKQGEKFVGYAPFIVIRSTYPAEVVDRAAGLAAGAYYRAAKKHFTLIPLTELETTSKKKAKP